MNNDLSFWRKLILDITNTPKTDADIAYLYRELVRPEIPASALWDAERGAQERANTEVNLKKEMKPKNFRKEAVLNRGWGIDQTEADMPKKTPTGRIMEQLMNPDVLIVPKKEDMRNLWK